MQMQNTNLVMSVRLSSWNNAGHTRRMLVKFQIWDWYSVRRQVTVLIKIGGKKKTFCLETYAYSLDFAA